MEMPSPCSSAGSRQTDRQMRTDLLLIALLGSNSLLSFALSPPDLLIGICQLAHQICLRSVALSSSVLTELTLNCCQLSLCTGLQLPTYSEVTHTIAACVMASVIAVRSVTTLASSCHLCQCDFLQHCCVALIVTDLTCIYICTHVHAHAEPKLHVLYTVVVAASHAVASWSWRALCTTL